MLEELDNVLGGSLQRVIMAAMRDEAERDAHILYKAMKGMGYDEETLLEILYVLLCTLAGLKKKNTSTNFDTPPLVKKIVLVFEILVARVESTTAF